MLEQKVEHIISPLLTELGFDLVQVRSIGGKTMTLDIRAERHDGAPITLGDCEKISKRVAALLDVEDVISTKYRLEVSSPGLDRPLTKPSDFKKYEGKEISLRLTRPIEQGRKFKGKILEAGSDSFSFQPENFKEVFSFDYSSVDTAKLVLTDEMFGKGVKKKF